MKSVEVSEIEGVIKLIDERAQDLTMTWKRLNVNPQPQAVPEKIRQALFELSWMRESLQELISNAKLSQSK